MEAIILEKGSLSINSENIFPIIKKWLYSDHDIFVRELVSNGSDAITKLKKLSLMGEFTLPEEEKYFIKVIVSPEEKTMKFIDNGIGMTEAEVKEYINQIAFSGAADFLSKYKDKASEDQIIGHFGLGFYSAFMVAHRVTIDTKSYNGAPAVHWESEEGVDFEMGEGEKSDRGTEITLYLNEDSYEFANEYRAKEILEKYCSFMPVEIFFSNGDKPDEEVGSVLDDVKADDQTPIDGEKTEEKKGPKPINETEPLWTKHPNECKDEDYKDFFRKVFHDYKEPLFYIHLNMDYPFNLKGILYFPKVNLEYENADGVIKLYSNQVFIADNIKEVIPEFLLLLKGVIDCPDLPLNVSRSALQNDGFVKKISDYITKKVADKLTGMCKTDRENYEKYWDDIAPFIKYGCLKDSKFCDKIKDFVLFKDINAKYMTMNEYLDAVDMADKKVKPAEEATDEEGKSVEAEVVENTGDAAEPEDKEPEKGTIYYVTDEQQQGQYIKMFRDENLDAVVLTQRIDQPFITQLESQNDKICFKRIDADITDAFKAPDASEEEMKAELDELTALFRKVLNKEKLEVRVTKLKDANISSIITLDEESRRMADMMKMYSFGGAADTSMFGGDGEILTLNANNDLVKYIYEHKRVGEKRDLMVKQLYDLAMLSHKPLAPEAMTEFIARSNEIMMLLTK